MLLASALCGGLHTGHCTLCWSLCLAIVLRCSAAQGRVVVQHVIISESKCLWGVVGELLRGWNQKSFI